MEKIQLLNVFFWIPTVYSIAHRLNFERGNTQKDIDKTTSHLMFIFPFFLKIWHFSHTPWFSYNNLSSRNHNLSLMFLHHRWFTCLSYSMTHVRTRFKITIQKKTSLLIKQQQTYFIILAEEKKVLIRNLSVLMVESIKATKKSNFIK